MSKQGMRKRNSIKLPLVLQRELGIQDATKSNGARRKYGAHAVVERKEKRKALRNEKKNHHPRKDVKSYADDETSNTGSGDSLAEEDFFTEEVHTLPTVLQQKEPMTRPRKPESILENVRNQLSPSLSSGGSRASSPGLVLDPASRSFKQHAAEDDAEIVALERRLGIRGKGSRLGDDMLDFVLDGLEEESDSKKRKREGQSWLDQKRRKVDTETRHRSQVAVNGNGNGNGAESQHQPEEEEEDDDEDEEDYLDSEDDNEKLDDLNDLDGGLSGTDDMGEDAFSGFDSDKDHAKDPIVARKVRENPYVAPAVPGSTSNKYVPPSLRRRQEDKDQSGLETLRRQLQGQLNKLSEANIISIVGEIEKLYQTNARQDVTTVVIDLILTSFCIRTPLPNTFIILHAAFLAAIYKIKGVDFGADLLVKLIETFDREHQRVDGGKGALNLISLLANLFTFNVVGSNIIYDHIRLLLSQFSEANVELLLRVVRDCGPQLRSDDSSSLKSIVQMMQKVSLDNAKDGQSVNVRTKVMMDTITDLKNNKMRNAASAVGAYGEHITRMRKALGTLNDRLLKATEPLRITREDIANSDKRGKWWLVGASWKGHEQSNEHDENSANTDIGESHDLTPTQDGEVDFLALAKQYGMNTDIRRSIFVAIASADDCRDAQTRLLKIRLSKKQDQEITKVLLRLARAEPYYNPYYTLLAKNLCKDNKKMRMGLQFGLWNFFDRMGEKAEDDSITDESEEPVEMHEIANMAKMYAHLIFHGHLSLGVLKILNIGFLRELATMFLELLLISVMTQPRADDESLMTVFGRARETPQIVKGLRYFVKKNVRRSDLVPEDKKGAVKEGCRIASLALQAIELAEEA